MNHLKHCIAHFLAIGTLALTTVLTPAHRAHAQTTDFNFTKNDGSLSIGNLIATAPDDMDRLQYQLVCSALVKEHMYAMHQNIHVLFEYQQYLRSPDTYKSDSYNSAQIKDIGVVIQSVFKTVFPEKRATQIGFLENTIDSLIAENKESMYLWLVMDEISRKRHAFSDITVPVEGVFPQPHELDQTNSLFTRAVQRNGYSYVEQFSTQCLTHWRASIPILRTFPSVKRWDERLRSGLDAPAERFDDLYASYEERLTEHSKRKGAALQDDVFKHLAWFIDAQQLDAWVRKYKR